MYFKFNPPDVLQIFGVYCPLGPLTIAFQEIATTDIYQFAKSHGFYGFFACSIRNGKCVTKTQTGLYNSNFVFKAIQYNVFLQIVGV